MEGIRSFEYRPEMDVHGKPPGTKSFINPGQSLEVRLAAY